MSLCDPRRTQKHRLPDDHDSQMCERIRIHLERLQQRETDNQNGEKRYSDAQPSLDPIRRISVLLMMRDGDQGESIWDRRCDEDDLSGDLE